MLFSAYGTKPNGLWVCLLRKLATPASYYPASPSEKGAESEMRGFSAPALLR
jgi:hypothetical protein